MITQLIDKQDAVEVIRDKIALILASESASQVALASSQSHPNPSLWDLRVYIEHSNPWESFPPRALEETPVVNIWWDTSSFEQNSSDTFGTLKTTATINIDCYGYGVSAETLDGHSPGDKASALEAQRAIKLARNILMASEYTYLDLRGQVFRRWPQSISVFQPQQGGDTAEHITGARLVLSVEFNEFSPQYDGETLDYIAIDIQRALDNRVIAQAHYDYST